MSRALLLSGGAFRGAIQVPVIEELCSRNYYDVIYGVSVGSINGAMAAQDDLDKLREIWDTVDGVGSFLRPRWYWPFNGYYDMSPLRAKIERYLSLDRLKTLYRAGVVSGTTGEYFNFKAEDMLLDKEYHDVAQASCCQAGIMIPGSFIYKGKEHLGYDGGYRNIIPVPERKYNHIDVVACTPIDRMKMKDEFKKKDLLSMLLRGVQIMQDEIFDRDISSIIWSGADSITAYAPQENPGDSFMADKKTIESRYKLGEEALRWPHYIK